MKAFVPQLQSTFVKALSDSTPVIYLFIYFSKKIFLLKIIFFFFLNRL